MAVNRTKLLQDLYDNDREYFADLESDLRHCTKVWDISMTSSVEYGTTRNKTTHEIDMFEFLYNKETDPSSEEAFLNAQTEYLAFSDFDKEGSFKGKEYGSINSNNIFIPNSKTRMKHNPYDK